MKPKFGVVSVIFLAGITGFRFSPPHVTYMYVRQKACLGGGEKCGQDPVHSTDLFCCYCCVHVVQPICVNYVRCVSMYVFYGQTRLFCLSRPKRSGAVLLISRVEMWRLKFPAPLLPCSLAVSNYTIYVFFGVHPSIRRVVYQY